MIEYEITKNQESKLKIQKYVEDIFKYTQEEFRRVHGEKITFKIQQGINDMRKKFFQQYKKIISNINKDKIMQLQ